jgi:xylan 1,4-beta-xylosidase
VTCSALLEPDRRAVEAARRIFARRKLFMPIELRADRLGGGTKLAHFWSVCVGAGRASEGLRAGWLEQLRRAHAECGFRYVRFHGLFHDDMFVYREESGRAVYNFQYVDELFDRLLDIGVRPFVEFGFCPGDLATARGTVFWWQGHGSPPKDYDRWAELIRRITRHWISRYGADEVRQWYFEVWNEPNLRPFFQGTRSEYFQLYEVTARALKAIDGALRVGGPATSNFVPDARFDGETEDMEGHEAVLTAPDLDALDWRPVWIEAFLAFCHGRGLPVDFVSCHPYPTDWALDEHGQGRKSTRGVDATPQDMARLQALVAASPYPAAEIHLTEWNSSSSARDFTHDFLQAATFVVRTMLAATGIADSLSYWTFTDIFEEGGAGDTIFHGGFGLINLQGIVKPAYHAYRFLAALGDEALLRAPAGVVTRDSRTGKLAALAFHYPPEMPLSVPASFDVPDVALRTLALGQPGSVSVTLTGLEPYAPLSVETLDRSHGNARAVWEDMGQPEHPNREQTQALRQGGEATRREFLLADADGQFLLRRPVEPWSVLLIREL